MTAVPKRNHVIWQQITELEYFFTKVVGKTKSQKSSRKIGKARKKSEEHKKNWKSAQKSGRALTLMGHRIILCTVFLVLGK